MSAIPKKDSKPFHETINTIFRFSNIDLAQTTKSNLLEAYADKTAYQKACQKLDEGFEDNFQYTLVGGHNRLNSTNLIERLNEKVHHREKVICIFLNVESANRLIDKVLIDKLEEWLSSSRKYIQFLLIG